MAIVVHEDVQKVLITMDGELTIFTAQEALDQIRKPIMTNKDIEMDLSNVSEIDSAGLQILLSVKMRTVLQNTSLKITSHSVAVLELLSLSDLIGFFGDPLVIESALA